MKSNTVLGALTGTLIYCSKNNTVQNYYSYVVKVEFFLSLLCHFQLLLLIAIFTLIVNKSTGVMMVTVLIKPKTAHSQTFHISAISRFRRD